MQVRDVVDTLLELAYMPPHRAISTGKVRAQHTQKSCCLPVA